MAEGTGLLLGVASMGAGAYLGYHHSQGIPLEEENLELALMYGPALVRGGLGALHGGLTGLTGGAVMGATFGWEDSTLERVAKGAGGAIIGTLAGASIGGIKSGIKGGVHTLIGYGFGYVVGHMTK